jgi:LCP family protein required for cell wall assembly
LGETPPDFGITAPGLDPARRRPHRRARIARRIIARSLAVVVLLGAALGFWLWRAWNEIPRFEDLSDDWGEVVPASPSPDGIPTAGGVLPLRPLSIIEGTATRGATPDGLGFDPAGDDAGETVVLPEVVGREEVETFLVFSTGTTEITDEQARAIGVSDPELRGDDTLTDVLMVLVVGRSTGRMAVVSVPRDTWLRHRGSRVNRVFDQFGPAALAGDVAALTGLRIDHVIRVNMMGFVQLTDLLGGVEVTIDRPIRDTWTGLDLPAGTARLDGETALRYVRSRRAEHFDGERWIPDGSSDFGRMQRQRAFLVGVIDAAWGLDVVTSLPALLDAVQRNVVLDEDLGIGDLAEIARLVRNGGGGLPGYQLSAVVGWVGPASVVFVDPVAARELVGSVVATVIS